MNKEIEKLRSQGLVGSSLQAELDIYAPKRVFDDLLSLGDDLRFVFIVSNVNLHLETDPQKELISVYPSEHKKCDRCWHYRADVGADAEHPHICGRCVSNLFGSGEVRSHA